MGTMYDTTSDLGQTFHGLPVEAVAAYGNGKYANYTHARSQFPNARILQIDVKGQGIGDTGDFEPGDMRYARAGSWAKERIQAGVKRPVLYFSVSNWQAVMDSLRAAGVSRNDVRIWTAHYNGRPHLCSRACGFGVSGTADATQWGSADAHGTLPSRYVGRNIDISMTADDFWGGTSAGTKHHSSALRHGDTGHGVERLTRRLSYVPSKTGHPYLDGTRRRVDAETVSALRRFQKEHHLHVDGVFGRESRHALDRAVRLEKARRAKPASREEKLVGLVNRYRRSDAETGRAWKELAAYGATRRAAVAQAHAKAEAGGEVTLADIAAILTRIEHEVQTLGEPKLPPAPPPVVATAVVTAGGNGAPAPAQPVARKPVVIDDLTDAELIGRVERLDHMLDTAREALIARYVAATRLLAHTTKPDVVITQRPPVRTPAKRPAPKRASVGARKLQATLNAFSRRYLKGLAPLATDGKIGPATKQRIRAVKYYLGYTGTEHRSTKVDAKLLKRMHSPKSARHSNPAMLARAAKRRRHERKHAKRAQAPRAGVATFDNKQVAAWMKPYLVWARKHGWQGTLSSGWRSPEYSESLCKAKCGAPKCSGTCAGRSSNHVGRAPHQGAIDVTHAEEFARLMRKCPYKPRIFNDLPKDPVHFSATGH